MQMICSKCEGIENCGDSPKNGVRKDREMSKKTCQRWVHLRV